MKLSKDIIEALNNQMIMEYQASINYLAMANYAQYKGYDVAYAWLDAQHEEEIVHGEKIRMFLLDNGIQPKLGALETPPNEFKGIIDLLKVALAQEKDVTASIDKIMKLAKKEENYRCEIFIGWYVTEQIEEETTFETLIDKCEKVGEKELFKFEKQIFVIGE